MPDMTPVDSSNIRSVGYDSSNRELYVQFLDNSTYIYSEVPPQLHEELLRAPSKGSYLNRAIKGSYAYRLA
jgi:hypothetical protein